VEEFSLATGLATTAFLNSFGSDRVLGASAAQMLLGVGRPGLSRGLIEDVRDTLEASLWYMRLEGGRYRFTTEPNLNKVVLERRARTAYRPATDQDYYQLRPLSASARTWTRSRSMRRSAPLTHPETPASCTPVVTTLTLRRS
jgi:hypothetical protein